MAFQRCAETSECENVFITCDGEPTPKNISDNIPNHPDWEVSQSPPTTSCFDCCPGSSGATVEVEVVRTVQSCQDYLSKKKDEPGIYCDDIIEVEANQSLEYDPHASMIMPGPPTEQTPLMGGQSQSNSGCCNIL